MEMSLEWLREKSKLVKCELRQIIEKEKTTKEAFVKGDYRQCAENTLALLGSATSDFFFHHKPGTISNARWMGKVLYCQKMLMWSEQLSYNGEFVNKLQRINLFVALFYVPAWLKCNTGMDAPIKNLNFLQDMLMYKNEDPIIADSAFNKLSSHQWYLTQETVAFSFFSQHPLLTNEIKRVHGIPAPININTR